MRARCCTPKESALQRRCSCESSLSQARCCCSCPVTTYLPPCTTWSQILQGGSSIERLYRHIKGIRVIHVTEPKIRTLLNPNPRLSPLMILPPSSSPLNRLEIFPLSIRLFKRFPPSRSRYSPLSPIPPIWWHPAWTPRPPPPPKALETGENENRRGCPQWTRWESQFSRPLPLSPLIMSLCKKMYKAIPESIKINLRIIKS